MLHLDPPTNQRELEVQKIVHLHNLANQLPDAFTDTRRVTKSFIPAENVPSRVDVPKEQTDGNKMNEPRVQLKRGRPAGSKDKNPKKKKKLDEQNSKVREEPDIEICLKEDINGKVLEEPVNEKCLKEGIDKDDPDDEKGTKKYEISINYARDEKLWIRNKIKDVDGMFSFSVSKEIDHENDDPDPGPFWNVRKDMIGRSGRRPFKLNYSP